MIIELIIVSFIVLKIRIHIEIKMTFLDFQFMPLENNR